MDNFEGHRNPSRHHSVGSHRAWCHCGEWCYPRIDAACCCCREALALENPCPTCGGTGFVPIVGEGSPSRGGQDGEPS